MKLTSYYLFLKNYLIDFVFFDHEIKMSSFEIYLGFIFGYYMVEIQNCNIFTQTKKCANFISYSESTHER